MASQSKSLVARIRDLLDRLVASRRLSKDEQEIVADEVAAEARELPREGILDALDQAIGSRKSRRDEAVYLLSELTDVPEVVERIEQWLSDPDPQCRSWLIQVVRRQGLKQFVPQLNHIIEHDPDSFCRDLAVHAAGRLRAEESLPVLLRLAERGDGVSKWRMAWALKDFATEECRPHLKRWFEECTDDKSTRITAAWGLGKLGDKQAIAYLVQMLDDPDERGEKFYRAGESCRAAQALCDIYNWPYERSKSNVAETATRVKEIGLTD